MVSWEVSFSLNKWHLPFILAVICSSWSRLWMKREIAKSRAWIETEARQRRDFFLGFMFEPRNRRELSNFAQSRSRSRRENFSSVRDPARSLSRCKGHGVFRDTLLFLIGLNLIRKTDRYVGADSSISNRRPSLLPSSWNNQIILNHKRSSCDLSYKWSVYKYDQIGH